MYNTVYNDTEVTNAFDDSDLNYFIEGKVTYLSRRDWQSTYPQTVTSFAPTDEMKDSLEDKRKYENGTIDTKQRIEVEDVTYGKANTNDVKLFDMIGKDFDAAEWDELLDCMTIEEISDIISDARYEIPGVTSVSFPGANGNDNPTGLWEKYKYSSLNATTGEPVGIEAGMLLYDGITEEGIAVEQLMASMYCSEPVLAATFNDQLAARQGDMFAEDALYCGRTCVVSQAH